MLRHLLCALLCFHLGACGKKEAKAQKPIVLVSIPPYAYFVKKIAGDAVVVTSLVPEGANAHIYEPTPKEVQNHQNARLWVRLGEAIDYKVAQVFKENNPGLIIVDVAKGLDLMRYCEEDNLVTEHMHCQHEVGEGMDLHVWLSPKLAQVQAQKIADGLRQLFPEKMDQLQGNLNAFINELQALDKSIAAILEPMKGKAILVSHPAFGYFCHDYHLIQLSVEVEGKEPLPQQVTQLISQIKQYSVHSVLLEPQFSNKGAEMIAASLGLQTHMVDPYAENYSENLLAIAKVIAE